MENMGQDVVFVSQLRHEVNFSSFESEKKSKKNKWVCVLSVLTIRVELRWWRKKKNMIISRSLRDALRLLSCLTFAIAKKEISSP